MEHFTVITAANKWFGILPFPVSFEPLFDQLLVRVQKLELCAFEDYDLSGNKSDFEKNLIMFLFFCEELSYQYKVAGIPKEILHATLEDLPTRVKRHYDMTGTLGLSGTRWIAPIMQMKQFRLGRLVFCMHTASIDVLEKGICKGDPVVDIHVPGGSPLTPESCEASLAQAELFFSKFFPDYKYYWYTCHSWLLDDILVDFLKPESNILRFANLFEPVFSHPEDSILHFVFKYGIKTRTELHNCSADTEFAQKVKEYALAGGVFHNTLGIRPRKGSIR